MEQEAHYGNHGFPWENIRTSNIRAVQPLAVSALQKKVDGRIQKTWEFIAERAVWGLGSVTNAEVYKYLSVNESTSRNYLKLLLDIGEIRQIGSNYRPRFTLSDAPNPESSI